MKKLLYLFMLLLALTNIVSCSKDSDDKGGQSTKNTGRYVGVLVGSSGWFVVNFTEENPSATVHFDGADYYLSTGMPIKDGNSYTDVLFEDGTISMRFSVDESGQQPKASFSIPGHDVVATIGYAEENIIHLYEGTSHAEYEGTFIDYTYNLALDYADNTYEIIERVVATNGSKPIGETNTYRGAFSISGNIIVFEIAGGSFSCNISGTRMIRYEDGNTIEFELVYESDNAASPTPPEQAQFTGTFSGKNLMDESDSGTLSFTVWYFQNAPVEIEGSGYSNLLKDEFRFAAGVDKGAFEAGSTIGGYTFSGTISGNTIQGTWGNKGTFAATKQ